MANRAAQPPAGGVQGVNTPPPAAPVNPMANPLMGNPAMGQNPFYNAQGNFDWSRNSALYPTLMQLGAGMLSAPRGSSLGEAFGRGTAMAGQYLKGLPDAQYKRALMQMQVAQMRQKMQGAQNLAAIVAKLPPNHPARVAYQAGDISKATEILYKLSPEYIKSRAVSYTHLTLPTIYSV